MFRIRLVAGEVGLAAEILEIRVGNRTDEYPQLAYFFATMGSRKKPDPELLPIHRPRCPKCQMRMITAAVADGPEGFERRTFKCMKCAHTDDQLLVSDPLKSDAVGWLSGELGRSD
jgi:hypothetical protein